MLTRSSHYDNTSYTIDENNTTSDTTSNTSQKEKISRQKKKKKKKKSSRRAPQPDQKRILQGKNNPLPWTMKTRLVPQMNRDAMTSTWLGGSCDLRKTLIGGQLHWGSISPAVPRPSRNYSIHKQRKDIKILFPGKYLIYRVYTVYTTIPCIVHSAQSTVYRV